MKAYFYNKNSFGLRKRVPFELTNLPIPEISGGEILIKVLCCSIGGKELREIEAFSSSSTIPGQQAVGIIVRVGNDVKQFKIGERVGVSRILSACGTCKRCKEGYENFCIDKQVIGKNYNGGLAEYMKIHQSYTYSIPTILSDAEAVFLLDAGALSYRSLRLGHLENGNVIGFMGFSQSGRLAFEMARHLFTHSKIFVFEKQPNSGEPYPEGIFWTGETTEKPPAEPDVIIDSTNNWQTLHNSIAFTRAGGRIVINSSNKVLGGQEELITFNCKSMGFQEKEIKIISEATKVDVEKSLDISARISLHPKVLTFPFEEVNQALRSLKKSPEFGAVALYSSR